MKDIDISELQRQFPHIKSNVSSQGLDIDFINMAKLAGISVDRYYIPAKKQQFKPFQLRVDYAFDSMSDSDEEDSESINCAPVCKYQDLKQSLDKFADEVGIPHADDPQVIDIVNTYFGNSYDFKTILDIITELYQPDILESSSSSYRYVATIDTTGDAVIYDSIAGIAKNYSGSDAADIKRHMKELNTEELQSYLDSFFNEDDHHTMAINEELESIVETVKESDGVALAQQLVEYISNNQPSLVDTVLITNLRNYISRNI